MLDGGLSTISATLFTKSSGDRFSFNASLYARPCSSIREPTALKNSSLAINARPGILIAFPRKSIACPVTPVAFRFLADMALRCALSILVNGSDASPVIKDFLANLNPSFDPSIIPSIIASASRQPMSLLQIPAILRSKTDITATLALDVMFIA